MVLSIQIGSSNVSTVQFNGQSIALNSNNSINLSNLNVSSSKQTKTNTIAEKDTGNRITLSSTIFNGPATTLSGYLQANDL